MSRFTEQDRDESTAPERVKLPERFSQASFLTIRENRCVVRCRDESSSAWVAVKCLLPPYGHDEEEAFRAEYLRLEALDHPNWVRPGGYFSLSSGGFGFDLELSAGRPLTELPLRGWLPEIAEVARQILSGLHSLHVMKVAHLDLKADQVLVSLEGRESVGWGSEGREDPSLRIHVHLVDLGLSHAFGAKLPPTGTPGYMAPELLRGSSTWDARTDLYAFGVLLHELIWNAPPFAGETPGDVLRAQLAGIDLGDEFRRGEVPRPLVRLIAELLEVDPELRPRSAVEVWGRLWDIAAALGAGHLSPLLTGARDFPFVGRDEERHRVRRWLDAAAADRTVGRRLDCCIESERFVGADRLVRRLVAEARTLGWEGDAGSCTLRSGDLCVHFRAETTPATVDELPPSRFIESREALRIVMGPTDAHRMVQVANAFGVESMSLATELVRRTRGRLGLLRRAMAALPPHMLAASYPSGLDVESMVDRVPAPEIWDDWVEAGVGRLERGAYGRLLRESIEFLATGAEWNLPDSVLPVRRSPTADRWLAESIVRGAPEEARDLAVEHLRGACDDTVFLAIVSLVARARTNDALAAAIEQLHAAGYYEAVLVLVSRAVLGSQTGSLPNGVWTLFLAALRRAGRTRLPIPLPSSLAAEVEAPDGTRRLLAAVVAFREGLVEETRSHLLAVREPDGLDARLLWIRLAREAGLEAGLIASAIPGDTGSAAPAPLEFELASLESDGIPRRLDAADLLRVKRIICGSWREADRISLLARIGTDAFQRGLLSLAEECFQEMVRLLPRWSGGVGLPWAYLNLGGVLFESAQLGAVRELLRLVIAHARARLSWELAESAQANLAIVCAEMGLLPEALTLCEGVPPSTATAHSSAHVWTRAGWDESVLGITGWALGQPLEPLDQVHCLTSRATVLHRSGAEEATRAFEESIALSERIGAHADSAETLLEWLWCELDSGPSIAAVVIADRLKERLPAASSLTQRRAALALAEWDFEAVECRGASGKILERLAAIGDELLDSGLGYYAWRCSWLVARARLESSHSSGAGARDAAEAARLAILRMAADFSDPRHVQRFMGLPACRRFTAFLDAHGRDG